jgi:hypothetical protein
MSLRALTSKSPDIWRALCLCAILLASSSDIACAEYLRDPTKPTRCSECTRALIARTCQLTTKQLSIRFFDLR